MECHLQACSAKQKRLLALSTFQNLFAVEIPTKVLSNTTGPLRMPVIDMGSALDFTCKKDTKEAIIEAVKQGYRHFDTAASYGSEKALGEALKEAIELGLVSRENLFVTSKLWNSSNGVVRPVFDSLVPQFSARKVLISNYCGGSLAI
ncbi:NADP-dependent oxidoreductase domain [Sesbania bispinosa]|nr:NADP-dependent oxidoreductase domain [Sesbania bispinosa]